MDKHLHDQEDGQWNAMLLGALSERTDMSPSRRKRTAKRGEALSPKAGPVPTLPGQRSGRPPRNK